METAFFFFLILLTDDIKKISIIPCIQQYFQVSPLFLILNRQIGNKRKSLVYKLLATVIEH